MIKPAITSAVQPVVLQAANTEVAEGGKDPDGLAYIAAVTAAKGSAPTSAQQTAINDFVIAEKAANRWNSHKRIYFPVWNNAPANALCLKTVTSGSWISVPVPSVGFIQGNGTSQAFNFGTTPTALGFTNASACSWYLSLLADNRSTANVNMGVISPTTNYIALTSNSATDFRVVMIDGNQSSIFPQTRSTHTGVILCSLSAGTRRTIRRHGNVVDVWQSVAHTPTGTPPTHNMMALCLNNGGTAANFSNARFGGYGLSLGLAPADADAFTLNIKTLWEALSGLTLP